jgi:uncharacterized protein YecT (DUF1311 family)
MFRLIAIVAMVVSPVALSSDSECSDRPECWPEGSAMHTGLTGRQELEKADKELNKVYARIMASLPADSADDHPRRSLIEAQRAWIKWRDAHCNLVGEISGGMRMWKSAYSSVCLADVTSARTAQLIELFEGDDED